MKNKLAKDFGRRIRLFREKRLKISQEELADRCNLHVTHISRLENGSRLPNLETISRICVGLRVQPSDILHLPGFDQAPVSWERAPAQGKSTQEILAIVGRMPEPERKAVLKVLKCYKSNVDVVVHRLKKAG